jgi:hypothetical protein
LWFSLSDDDQIITLHGKRLCLFSLERFCRILSKSGFQLLPISSEQYSLHGHEFLFVSLFAHRFEAEQQRQLKELCLASGSWEMPYPADIVLPDPIDWIKSNVSVKGEHADFIQPSEGEAPEIKVFNFSTGGVLNEFQKHVASVQKKDHTDDTSRD